MHLKIKDLVLGPGKGLDKTISKVNFAMVVHACNPSYTNGGRGRRITILVHRSVPGKSEII
jgi:hypothetical protein